MMILKKNFILAMLLVVSIPAFSHDPGTQSEFVISGNNNEEYQIVFYLNPHSQKHIEFPEKCKLSFSVAARDIVGARGSDSFEKNPSFDVSLQAGGSKTVIFPFEGSNPYSTLLVSFSKTKFSGSCKVMITERIASAVDGSTRASIASIRQEMLNNKYPENMPN